MHNSSDRGFVLASVLIILILLAFVTASILMSAQTNLHLVQSNEQQAQVNAVLSAGIRAAISLVDGSPQQFEPTQLPWSGYVTVGGELVEIEVSNEAARVDLNVVDPRLLGLLFESWGLDHQAALGLAARIADWRDLDDVPQNYGAEAPAYHARGVAMSGNRPFLNVAEVQRVLDFPNELAGCVDIFGTVYSGRRLPQAPYVMTFLGQVVDQYFEQTGQSASSNSVAVGSSSQVGRIYRLVVTTDDDGGARESLAAIVLFSGSTRKRFWVLDWFVPQSTACLPAGTFQ